MSINTSRCIQDDDPIQPCPYCGAFCHADFVHNGVGYQQCGPYHCNQCGATEIGPYDEPRMLTLDQHEKGWYPPDSVPGSSANVIGGKVVSHKQMEATYREKFEGNVEYLIPGVVEEWFEEIRK